MTLIILQTYIKAPVRRCFDLSLDVGVHMRSTAATGEKVVAGRTHGILALGETITWEALHLGLRRRLQVRVTAMNAPWSFTDEMISGDFKSMRHDHSFKEEHEGTLMTDRFQYETPYGLAGRFFDWLYLRHYMKRLLVQRNLVIRQEAERNE